MITKEQAQILLDSLYSHTKVYDLITNQQLVDAIRELKDLADKEDIVDTFTRVILVVHPDDKLTAIKVVRHMLDRGLKEAKDIVDRAYAHAAIDRGYGYVDTDKEIRIDLGLIATTIFNEKHAKIKSDYTLKQNAFYLVHES